MRINAFHIIVVLSLGACKASIETSSARSAAVRPSVDPSPAAPAPGPTPDPGDTQEVSAVIGPAGGTLDGGTTIPGLKVDVPAGAVDAPVKLVASLSTGDAGKPTLTIKSGDGADIVFKKDVTITLPDDLQGDGGDVTIRHVGRDGDEEDLASSGGTIATDTPLGTYAVLDADAGSGQAPSPAPEPTPAPAFTASRGLSGSVEGAAKTATGTILVGDFLGYGPSHAGRVAHVLADGTLDAAFNANLGAGFDYTPLAVATDASGRVLVAGMHTQLNGASIAKLVRFNANGTLDTAFMTALGSGPNSYVTDVEVDANGKILIVGAFTQVSGTATPHIARLNSDGTLDGTFVPGAGLDGVASVIAFGAGGKIYVSGSSFTKYDNVSRKNLVRLNADGSLDTAFTIGTGFDSYVYAVKEAPDGKVYAGGWFLNFNGTAVRRLIRLNSDGSHDTAFNSGGAGIGPNSANGDSVYAIDVTDDGKVLVGGNFKEYDGASVPPSIIRLNADGTVDSTFDPGPGANNVVRYVFKEASGRYLVTGNFTSVRGATVNGIARMASTGALVAPFDGNGTGLDGQPQTVAVDAAGDVYVSGQFTAYGNAARGRIARIHPDGGLDAAFAAGAGLDSFAYVMKRVSTKLYVGGLFANADGVSSPAIARLNADGTRDATFIVGTGFNNVVRDLEPADDGKIYAGGNFTTYDGTSAPGIARLDSDGTLDATFAYGTGFTGGGAITLAKAADGKLYVGGAFTAYQGTTVGRIVRLNPNGSPDGTFATGTGFNAIVDRVYLAPSGAIYVGGAFTSYNGTAVSRIVRLKPDGSLDNTFASTAFTAGEVYSMWEDANGKLYSCGYGLVSGTAVPSGLARLNADGTRDATFTVGALSLQLNERCYMVAPNPAGDRLYVAGWLRNAFDRATSHLLRIKLDGTLD